MGVSEDSLGVQLTANFEEEEQFMDLIKEKLSQTFLDKNKIKKIKSNWKIFKDMEPKERKDQVKKMRTDNKAEMLKEGLVHTENQKFIILGYDKVLKKIGKTEIRLVLVDADIPENMLRFLHPLCLANKVMIVGLKNFSVILRQILGFRTTVLGFYKSIQDAENPFYEIETRASNIYNSENIKKSSNGDKIS